MFSELKKSMQAYSINTNMFSEIKKNQYRLPKNLPETFTYKLALQILWMELYGC